MTARVRRIALAAAGLVVVGALAFQTSQRTDRPRSIVLAVQMAYNEQYTSYLHLWDGDSLASVARVSLHGPSTEAHASRDGLTILLTQGLLGSGGIALFAFDLATRETCELNEPVNGRFVASVDSRWSFSQRGNVGIDINDLTTHGPAGTIDAPGSYDLHPSPDGRWLFGTMEGGIAGEGNTLDVFDLTSRKLVRRLPIDGGGGAWVGGRFYYVARQDARTALWTIAPDTTRIADGVPLDLPGPNSAKLEPYNVTAVGDLLAVYAPLNPWYIFQNRSDAEESVPGGGKIPGGIFLVDPASGRVVAHYLQDVDVSRVAASADGQLLYVVDAGVDTRWAPENELDLMDATEIASATEAAARASPTPYPLTQSPNPARLIVLDAHTGAVRTERAFPPPEGARWTIDVAQLPESSLPSGEIALADCRMAEGKRTSTP